MQPTGTKNGGTPQVTPSGTQGRRARTDRLVLDATLELLAERGVRGLTIEGVADRAGVAKTTIYRRHRSKTDLALAALSVLLDRVDSEGPQPDAGDTRAELAALVNRTLELFRSTLVGRVMQGLVSEIAADPELARAYREHLVNRRLAEVRRLVERGAARGELRAGLNPEMVTDLFLGPIYYRLFLSGSPLDEAFEEELVTALHRHCHGEGD